MIVQITEIAAYDVMLGPGDHVMTIEAATWDTASVTLQESAGTSFEDSDDPYNTGSALTRTANGKSVRLTGGLNYRLNCTAYGGGTAGLKAIFNRAT